MLAVTMFVKSTDLLYPLHGFRAVLSFALEWLLDLFK